MSKKTKSPKKTQRKAFGITVLKAADKRIRSLKSEYEPFVHGDKFWNSSWLIMDFLKRQGLPHDSRVIEVGCGWGLASIYCAKNFEARVTGVDMDSAVFPYLKLHAEVNNVRVKTERLKCQDLRKKVLSKFDLMLGADICFWDELVDPVYKLIRRAVKAEVEQIIVADPGRPPFLEVCDRCCDKLGGMTKDWELTGTVRASGTLLIVGSLPH